MWAQLQKRCSSKQINCMKPKLILFLFISYHSCHLFFRMKSFIGVQLDSRIVQLVVKNSISTFVDCFQSYTVWRKIHMVCLNTQTSSVYMYAITSICSLHVRNSGLIERCQFPEKVYQGFICFRWKYFYQYWTNFHL